MRRPSFRPRFDSPTPLFGTFVKTPDVAIIEILAASEIDFVVIDQEHAPIDRRILDTMLFAALALDLPALVRVPGAEPSVILSALDSGAHGVLLPHIVDAGSAVRAADACRYRSGRGYSGAVRAMRGAGQLSEKIAAADAQTLVIAQVEDAQAISQSSAIAGCDGVDALFIGRGDLAVSMEAKRSDAPEIWEAARTIADGAALNGKPCWAFAASWEEADQLLSIGARGIVFSSDQALLRNSVSGLVSDARQRNQRLASLNQ